MKIMQGYAFIRYDDDTEDTLSVEHIRTRAPAVDHKSKAAEAGKLTPQPSPQKQQKQPPKRSTEDKPKKKKSKSKAEKRQQCDDTTAADAERQQAQPIKKGKAEKRQEKEAEEAEECTEKTQTHAEKLPWR